MDLPRAYLPFECIFEELPADIDQQGCKRPVLLWAAEGFIVATGRGSPVPQDHPNDESWKKRVKNPWGWWIFFTSSLPCCWVLSISWSIKQESHKHQTHSSELLLSVSCKGRGAPSTLKLLMSLSNLASAQSDKNTHFQVSSSSPSFTPLMCKLRVVLEAKHWDITNGFHLLTGRTE